MKDLDPLVFLAVFQEMLGPVFWLLIVAAVVGVGAFLFVILRDGEVNSKRLLQSELLGVLGGAGALIFMAFITHSGFTDAGGPIDWLLIGVIFGAGAVATTLIAYAAMGIFCSDCSEGADA